MGDVRYGAKRRLPTRASDALINALQRFPRQALHAARLGFVHPGQEHTGPMEFEAAVPDDMQQLLTLLRERGDN